MRLTGEAVEREGLDLASTTFAGFQCMWDKQESGVGLFLLARSRPL
jgi:hypothetical protein